MGEKTAISWCDHSWNPWQGCHKVSAGCANCYMYSEKIRYGQRPNEVVRSKPPTFNAPLSKKWAEPARVFTCSWSDFFIEEADAWRADAWDIIRRTPHLTYQILTKRPERIAAALPADWGAGWPNVWLGVSVENQEAAFKRLPPLIEAPATARFVSAEPLLGPVDLSPWLIADLGARGRARIGLLHWVIVGGESGDRARPCDVAWIRELVDQCCHADVAVFVKQLGAVPVMTEAAWRAARPTPLLSASVGKRGRTPAGLEVLAQTDPKGGEPAEWPADLRMQQFPEVTRG